MTSSSRNGDAPLRVAQVCHGSLGGSSRAACRLANALARRDHRVHLFSRFVPPWPLEPRVIAHALRGVNGDGEAQFHQSWSETDRAGFADLLAAVLRAERFDVLHYHYAQPFADLVGSVAARLGDRMPPAIGTLHGTDLTRSLDDGTKLAPLGVALAATDALTTVSQHMSRLMEPLRGAIPLPQVLPNFVEDEWPGTGPPARRAPPAILHVSNFRAVKDVGLLARLFLAVCQRTAAELWLVGDGPELPVLRRLLECSPAASQVRYFGIRAEPQAQFRAAALLLSTSLEESFGLAVLEAMACGTPVVATAVGGVPELVEDEVTGLLFAPTDWERTAARIAALLEAPERRLALGRACLARAAPLRESHVIAGYEGLYRRTLRHPAGGLEA